jgi:photosystem II stability/assembly factor-like uncharacterized protein
MRLLLQKVLLALSVLLAGLPHSGQGICSPGLRASFLVSPEGQRTGSPSHPLSLVEVVGVPHAPPSLWLIPPGGSNLTGVAIADSVLLHTLHETGVTLRSLGPYDESKLYYLVQKGILVSEERLAQICDVMWRTAHGYLVAVDFADASELNALGAHMRLLRPTAKGSLRDAEGRLPSAKFSVPAVRSPMPSVRGRVPPELSTLVPGVSYSDVEQFWIDWMAGQVSDANILRHLKSLTGESELLLAGGTDTVLTRYSFSTGCRSAAEYIYGQFDSMGVAVEYDYYFGVAVARIGFSGLAGYVVGAEGTILHTEDGGNIWESQVSGTSQHLFDTSVIAPDSCWISGREGTLLRTFDGGDTWTLLPTGTTENLVCVEFLNSCTGWVCTDGQILKTIDGGLTWSPQYVTSGGEYLVDIEFTDEHNGWVSGYPGQTVLHTSDGGETWSRQTTGAEGALQNVCFVDSLRGWAVGSLGTIVHTDDGGLTWEVQTSGTEIWLYGVCFTDSLRGWVVGSEGLILHTEDGGTQWSAQQSGANASLFRSVAFIDALHGWVSGNDVIIRTEDGGETWVSLNENIPDRWANVVATLEGGTTPSDIYIVCGHYDSISRPDPERAPGADDNATGTSLVLEAARILRDFSFHSTIKFICFTGEEQSCTGSKHYVGQSVASGENIAGVLNFDMVGWGTPTIHFFYDGTSVWLVDHCVSVRDAFVPRLDVTPEMDPYMIWSDHFSFWQEGYSAICGIEVDFETNPYYHSTGDTVGNLTLSFVTDVTRLAVASLASLAGLDSLSAPPQVPQVPAISLSKNYPNPFNPSTRIPFRLSASKVPVDYALKISDPAGRIVKLLEQGRTGSTPIEKEAIWDGTDISGRTVASGVYICSLTCGEEQRAHKIVLVR